MTPDIFSHALKHAMVLQKSDLKGLQKGDILLTTYDAEDTRTANTPDETLGSKNDKKLPFYRKVLGDPSRHLQGGYTHSAVYAGNGDVIEAEAKDINSVVRRSLAESLQDRDGAIVVRPKVPKKDRESVLRFAEKRIGNRYPESTIFLRQGASLLSNAATPLVDRKLDPKQKDHDFTCATLLHAGYAAKGHDSVGGGRSWYLGVPADFLDAKKNKLVKVIGKKDPLVARAGRIRRMKRVTAPFEKRSEEQSRVNWKNAITAAGALGGAAWGLSGKGRFDASWINPAWKGQWGMKQRLAQGALGAGTGAVAALPAQLASAPIIERAPRWAGYGHE